MPMKISLALGPRRPLSRQTAWGCFTTNLALPGFGSLIAGHKVGYAQAVLTMTGFVVSVLGAVRLFGWYVTTGRQLQDSEDPFVYFQQAWLAMRWAVLGLGLFGYAQAVLTMTCFVVSVLGAVRLFGWYVTTGRQLQDSEDPFVYFQQAWLAMR